MKKIIALLTLVMLTATVTAWASNATKDECVQKCKDAAAYIKENGIDAGIKAIADQKGPFVWKDTYVFLMDMEGKMVAHPVKPQLMEKGSLLSKSDANGKLHFAEFVKTAQSTGEGWVDYMFEKPGMPAPKGKTSYIYRVPGTEYIVGAGILTEQVVITRNQNVLEVWFTGPPILP